MKAVILAGGFGTRISEETHLIPKPMVQIGNRPILWHIMKTYSRYGVNDFIICLGYKGYLIKEYFANYFLHTSDITFDLSQNKMRVHENHTEPWCVTLVDTGEKTMTGGRLKRIRKYLDKENFCMTYGDGVCDVDIHSLIRFHQQTKNLATVTAVHPQARFGALAVSKKKAIDFEEKPKDSGWINGGFFVLKPEVLNLIPNDATVWESHTLPLLAKKRMLSVFKHQGFWQPMDTLRDKDYLEELWRTGKAPWKT